MHYSTPHPPSPPLLFSFGVWNTQGRTWKHSLEKHSNNMPFFFQYRGTEPNRTFSARSLWRQCSPDGSHMDVWGACCTAGSQGGGGHSLGLWSWRGVGESPQSKNLHFSCWHKMKCFLSQDRGIPVISRCVFQKKLSLTPQEVGSMSSFPWKLSFAARFPFPFLVVSVCTLIGAGEVTYIWISGAYKWAWRHSRKRWVPQGCQGLLT